MVAVSGLKMAPLVVQVALLVCMVAPPVLGCCLPQQYSSDLRLRVDVSGIMSADIIGKLYLDYKLGQVFMVGAGPVTPDQLGFPIRVKVKLGADLKNKTAWYSVNSMVMNQCNTYNIQGAQPESDALRCILDNFKTADGGLDIPPQFLTIDPDTCTPSFVNLTTNFDLAAMKVQLNFTSVKLSVSDRLRGRNKIPPTCKPGGDVQNPLSMVFPDNTAGAAGSLSGADKKRVAKRFIFDWAKEKATNALNSVKSAINNPKDTIKKIKSAAIKVGKATKEVAVKWKDAIAEEIRGDDE